MTGRLVRYRPEGSGAEVKTKHQALSFTKSNMADKIVRVCIRLGIGGLFVINASGELFPHQACKQVNALKDENGILVDVPETCRQGHPTAIFGKISVRKTI